MCLGWTMCKKMPATCIIAQLDIATGLQSKLEIVYWEDVRAYSAFL